MKMCSINWLLLVVLSCSSLSISRADSSFLDCGGVGNPSNKIAFTTFTLFPNPVVIHQTVHARAVVNLGTTVYNGNVTLIIMYDIEDNTQISIPGIDLCSLSSVSCPLSPGNHPISFDFYVPQIPAGVYTIRYTIAANTKSLTGCVAFNVTVQDSSQGNTYTSWFQAQLLGSAQFDNADYTKRGKGERVQVGKIGDFSPSVSAAFPWGTIAALQGSEDLVPPFFSNQGYIWGLYGSMTQLTSFPDGTRYQIYQGSVIVGYIDNTVAYNSTDNNLLFGEFVLNWTYTQSQGNLVTLLSGYIYPEDVATLPTGWPTPITFGRISPFTVMTDSLGNLQVNGSETYCKTACDANIEQGSNNRGSTFSRTDYILVFVLTLGTTAVALILFFSIRRWKKDRKRREEDTMFAERRKPQYGKSLVEDDIRQETRDHVNKLLDRSDGEEDDLSSAYSSPDERPKGRHGRRPRPITRSRSRSRSRSDSRSRSRTDPSASRSRTRSRSHEARDSRRRQKKPLRTPSSRSRSGSRSRSLSDYEDSHSPRRDSRDSSASRVTEEESESGSEK